MKYIISAIVMILSGLASITTFITTMVSVVSKDFNWTSFWIFGISLAFCIASIMLGVRWAAKESE